MRARLIVETGAASPQLSDLSPKDTIRLGRNSKNELVLDDPHASRFHAEVYCDGQKWYVRDLDTTNGTKVNGIKINEPTLLESNHVIGIGDTRFRFTLDSSAQGTAELPVVAGPAKTAKRSHTERGNDKMTERKNDKMAVRGNDKMAERGTEEIVAVPSSNDFSQTILHADELTALLQFMTASLSETTPHGLVTLALTTVMRQTLANVAGYLSLDADEPEFRIVLPAQAEVDTQLSRKLTQRVQSEKRAVWLGADRTRELDSDSLVGFRDAVGIPLCVSPAAGQPLNGGMPIPPEPLGALHLYKSSRLFAEREVRFCEVLAGCLASTLHLLRMLRALEADNTRLRDHAAAPCDILVGDSPAMKLLRQQIAQFARLPCTVLITGESGVGKELVALSLHQQSLRREGPLVTLNCGALPATLVEAELFGHKKGAFTGAEGDRTGAFLRADQGTLFLDEIGDMPLLEQVKLLRVLETKSLRHVGGDEEVKVDVRILAATNRDLKREIQEGRFRKDLFFRLGATILVPPLREHLEDIPALVEHFLARLTVEYRRRLTLSPTALERLQTYNWPGNVRQLRSVLETAVATSDGLIISLRHLDRLLLDEVPSAATDQLPTLNLEELEARAIRQALAQTGGNNTQAARLLGIHRDTLISKMKKFSIERRV
ncbi:MAG TPA: sigma 54-interacting transcriptional regulator [Gemmataceae bacterium]|nr:sigma 54-interacting transcriptional regulator [Gemmataceae bacterium]